MVQFVRFCTHVLPLTKYSKKPARYDTLKRAASLTTNVTLAVFEASLSIARSSEKFPSFCPWTIPGSRTTAFVFKRDIVTDGYLFES